MILKKIFEKKLQKHLLSAGQFFLHNTCRNKKWGEICCEHDRILKFAGSLGILWKKAPFDLKKALQKTTFSKKF